MMKERSALLESGRVNFPREVLGAVWSVFSTKLTSRLTTVTKRGRRWGRKRTRLQVPHGYSQAIYKGEVVNQPRETGAPTYLNGAGQSVRGSKRGQGRTAVAWGCGGGGRRARRRGRGLTLLEQVGQEVNSARVAIPIIPVTKGRGRCGHRALSNVTCTLEVRRGWLSAVIWTLRRASSHSARGNVLNVARHKWGIVYSN